MKLLEIDDILNFKTQIYQKLLEIVPVEINKEFKCDKACVVLICLHTHAFSPFHSFHSHFAYTIWLFLDEEEEETRAVEHVEHIEHIEAIHPGPHGPGDVFPAIWSEEGKYLANVLGDALVKGLTQVSEKRPDDPVEYLANFLKQYNVEDGVDLPVGVEIMKSALKERVPEGSGGSEVAQVVQEGHEGHRSASTKIPNGIHRALSHHHVEPEQEHLDHKDEQHDQEDLLDDQADRELDDDADLERINEQEEEEETQQGTRDDRGQSVLHFAAARPGGASTILAFLQNPSVNLSWRDERLRTARDIAEGLGRSDNVRTIDSWIVSLAVAGDKESLEQLLQDGYDHLTVEQNSTHIIDLAEKAGQHGVALFLRSIPDFQHRLEQLHKAIHSGDLEQVKKLTMTDHRLATALSKSGRTVLHVAVLKQEFNIVKFLCEQFPAVLKRGDNMERTPLHYAMGVEKVEKMTRVLVRNGAKRVVKDLRGRQPSYYFINREEIAMLQQQED